MFGIVSSYAHKLNLSARIVAQDIRWLSFLSGDDLKFFAKDSALLGAFRNDFSFHVAEPRESGSLLLCDHVSIFTHWHHAGMRCTCRHGEQNSYDKAFLHLFPSWTAIKRFVKDSGVYCVFSSPLRRTLQRPRLFAVRWKRLFDIYTR